MSNENNVQAFIFWLGTYSSKNKPQMPSATFTPTDGEMTGRVSEGQLGPVQAQPPERGITDHEKCIDSGDIFDVHWLVEQSKKVTFNLPVSH